jgi:uncharacterized protein (TIGR02996 family)
MPRDPERSFQSAIAETPEDLTPRMVYADWLEEHGDPRAEYLRLHCELLRGVDRPQRQARLERQAARLGQTLDLEWLRFIDLQDELYRLSHRCGGTPLPPAIRELWREAIWQTDPRTGERRFPVIGIAGRYQELCLEPGRTKGDAQSLFLEKNPERRDAFAAMFAQIDFLGEDDHGDQFGFWRYAEGVRSTDAPIISLSIGCEFTLGGKTLQDFFAVRWHELLHRDDVSWDNEDRKNFRAVRSWFAKRGIRTAPSLNAIATSLKDLPNPQERFERYCSERRSRTPK